jgi:hypothetical protein
MSLSLKIGVAFTLLMLLCIFAGISTINYPGAQAVLSVVAGLSLLGLLGACACLLWHTWMKP